MQETLKKYFGYDSFRPLQADIITSVLDGYDTLALMPTGGGKSICFQVPALMLGGMTIVVTPLISLIKDQVDNLRAHGVHAAAIYSGQLRSEQKNEHEKIINDRDCHFLYVSPERLGSAAFHQLAKNLDVRLLVVDEAHCISQWGYDFRPSYRKIAEARKMFPKAPILALTATATSQVCKDICLNLKFRAGYKVFAKSFSRPNLNYIVRRTDFKLEQLLHILTSYRAGSAIVYVRSRRKTHQLAQELTLCGINAAAFNAAMLPETKSQNQRDWNAGLIRVMVATNAFGMGIDKPDVRLVVHFDVPSSLEEYYQEAGRAGRDGQTAYCVMLVNKYDRATLKKRLTAAFPSKPDVVRLYDRICNYLHVAEGEGYDKYFNIDVEDFCNTFRYAPATFKAATKILEHSGYLTFEEEMFHATRVHIKIERNELYDRHDLNHVEELLLQALMREYPGLFTELVHISEPRLTQLTGLDHQTLTQTLIDLSRKGVITFIPASRSPYIHFDTSREEMNFVSISRDAYEERKKRMQDRIESVISYIYNDRKCRENLMLGYFGETRAEGCGKCDVCRDKRKKKGSSPSRSEQNSRLQGLLRRLDPDGDGSMLKMREIEDLTADEARDIYDLLADNL